MPTRKPRPPELPAKPHNRAHYDPVLIMAILMGRTVKVAATMAGIAERTAARRLADPEMQRAIAEARNDVFHYVTDGLKTASMIAVGTLTDVMQDEAAPAAARVTAASRVLELTMGRRYEVVTTSTVTTEVAPSEKMAAFLDKLQDNARKAAAAIEATYTQEPPSDEDHPEANVVAPPPTNGHDPGGVADPPPDPS